MTPHDELIWTMALISAPGLGPSRFKKLVEAFDGMPAIAEAAESGSPAFQAVYRKPLKDLKTGPLTKAAEAELELARKNQVDIVGWFDARYPAELKEIYDPPAVLYVRGELPRPEERKAAVVGSRQASMYGLKTARDLSRDLAAAGVVVVSGMARGIDAAAHEGALSAKGRTIAVLGSGLLKIYPDENRALADRIAASGAVISEYPLEMPAQPGFFPARNRIISGLSRAVIVVEAAERSGALITVDTALEQNRDVWAVPGNIDSARSRGTNALIKQGARVLTGAADLLEDLGETLLIAPDPAEGLSGEDRTLMGLLAADALHVDELIEKSGLPANRVAAVLMKLELQGRVAQLPGKHFSARAARLRKG